MNLTKYSSKNIESQLEHVCELIDLVKGDRGFREAVRDEEFCMLIKMQAQLFEEIKKREKYQPTA